MRERNRGGWRHMGEDCPCTLGSKRKKKHTHTICLELDLAKWDDCYKKLILVIWTKLCTPITAASLQWIDKLDWEGCRRTQTVQLSFIFSLRVKGSSLLQRRDTVSLQDLGCWGQNVAVVSDSFEPFMDFVDLQREQKLCTRETVSKPVLHVLQCFVLGLLQASEIHLSYTPPAMQDKYWCDLLS